MLDAKGRDVLGLGTDKHGAGVSDCCREPVVLRQEPIARDDKLYMVLLDQADNLLDVRVRRHGKRDVGVGDVRARHVGGRAYGDDEVSQPSGRCQDAARNLASIGDEEPSRTCLDHGVVGGWHGRDGVDTRTAGQRLDTYGLCAPRGLYVSAADCRPGQLAAQPACAGLFGAATASEHRHTREVDGRANTQRAGMPLLPSP